MLGESIVEVFGGKINLSKENATINYSQQERIKYVFCKEMTPCTIYHSYIPDEKSPL